MSDWQSSLEVHCLATGQSRVVLRTPLLMEAPNWHPEGWFLVNGEGRLWRGDTAGLTPIETGCVERCNNDHGILSDGRIVFSAHDSTGAGIHLWDGHRVKTLDLPRPSWWHGAHDHWLTYACVRSEDRVVRVARFDLQTGREELLTPSHGHHDGPDFSACGSHIWFNSDATGHAQIWRMRADGSVAGPVFRDGSVNWFPHPSPCGRHVLYLAYPPGTQGHPRNLEVALWLMSPEGGNRRQVAKLFGGQGTINSPCWAPDGQAFAYMRYARPVSGG